MAGLALLAVMVWLGTAAAAQAAEPLPVAEFFRRPKFVDMVMSPNGRFIAATAAGASGRVGLTVLDLQDLSKSKNVATFSGADVHSVEWVNDDRLIFSLTDRRLTYDEQKGDGLLAVDRDGEGGVRWLIERERGVPANSRTLAPNHWLRSVLRDGSSDVLVQRVEHDSQGQPLRVVLLRLDTRTGYTSNLSLGAPPGTFYWAVDVTGVPRVAVTHRGGKSALHWKAAPDRPWALVREVDSFGGRDGVPEPIFVDENNMLYARGRASADSDTNALLRIDMRSGTLDVAALLALDGYDYTGSLIRDKQGKVLGVHYLTDARETHWFAPDMAAIQKQVDALLPGTNNHIACSNCKGPNGVLVRSSSDRQPPVFLLFDAKTGTLSQLASSRPWIKPAAMATRDMLRITARDGLSIPVHVTRPVGQVGPAPTVVLVHRGPWVRGGEWRWESQSQFLASRGYVVIEPEFRGSAGFGDKLYRAGFKQWGLAMQDDIADATLWAIKQGHADAKRVCIAGADYGGYATLMGLIRYPEIYRCGFEWAGATDLALMYSASASNASEYWKDYGMPALIGDRVKDAEQLAATSPLKLAAKLKQPLLMAYGGEDRRVPIEHGLKMRDALRAHNPNVEWVSYPSEGHGWMLEANDIDFWTRVEKFLDRHLKNAP